VQKVHASQHEVVFTVVHMRSEAAFIMCQFGMVPKGISKRPHLAMFTNNFRQYPSRQFAIEFLLILVGKLWGKNPSQLQLRLSVGSDEIIRVQPHFMSCIHFTI
jgi:hypothetical protein